MKKCPPLLMAWGYRGVKARAYGLHKQHYKSHCYTHTPTYQSPLRPSHIYTNAHRSQSVYESAGDAASAEQRASCINDLSASLPAPQLTHIGSPHPTAVSI